MYEIRLAVCKARLEMLDLATAIDELTRLLQETAALYGENAPLTRGVREQLGKAHYYATWVLKTNGAAEERVAAVCRTGPAVVPLPGRVGEPGGIPPL